MFLVIGILLIVIGLIFLQLTSIAIYTGRPTWQDIVGIVLFVVGTISAAWSLGEFVFRIIPRFFI